jgi:predicted DNA-binding protein with PD1-like motif
MRYFSGISIGRVFILELVRGEKIIESIRELLEKEGIKNAYIASAIGSIGKLCFHRPTSRAPVTEDENLSLLEPFEIGGIMGTVIDGVEHLHFSAASKESVQIGHLEPGTEVLYLTEIVLIELKNLNLERKMTEEMVKKLFVKEH